MGSVMIRDKRALSLGAGTLRDPTVKKITHCPDKASDTIEKEKWKSVRISQKQLYKNSNKK